MITQLVIDIRFYRGAWQGFKYEHATAEANTASRRPHWILRLGTMTIMASGKTRHDLPEL